VTVRGAQRCTGVEADMRRASDQGIRGEARVEARVRDDQHVGRAGADRMVAEGPLPRRLPGLDAGTRLEPLARRVHQGHDRGRRPERVPGERHDPFEGGLLRRIQDRIAAQRGQPVRLLCGRAAQPSQRARTPRHLFSPYRGAAGEPAREKQDVKTRKFSVQRHALSRTAACGRAIMRRSSFKKARHKPRRSRVWVSLLTPKLRAGLARAFRCLPLGISGGITCASAGSSRARRRAALRGPPVST
jgi:hypothetical protein